MNKKDCHGDQWDTRNAISQKMMQKIVLENDKITSVVPYTNKV